MDAKAKSEKITREPHPVRQARLISELKEEVESLRQLVEG